MGSYHEYVGAASVVDVKFMLEIISHDKAKAIQNFREFKTAVNDNTCLDISNENKRRMPKDEAKEIIKRYAR